MIDEKELTNKLHDGKHLITTLSGKKINILNPEQSTITQYDIIKGLSKIIRYNGQIEAHYSVLAHVNLCVYVFSKISHDDLFTAYDSNDMKKFIFFHDAAEAYLGDVTRPLKYIPEFYEIYSKFEQRFEDVIYKTFVGRLPTEEEKAVIKVVDNIVLAFEHERFDIRTNRLYVGEILKKVEENSKLTQQKLNYLLNQLHSLLKSNDDDYKKVENLYVNNYSSYRP